MPSKIGFKILIVLSICALLKISSANAEVPRYCLEWFQRSGAKPGTGRDCVWKCVSNPVDMGTFDCGSYCDELCGRQVEEKYSLGVCFQEGVLSLKDGKNALAINSAADRAIELTTKNFGASRQDDESDAFRHFVWASLSAKATNLNISRSFLDAHESCETQDVGQEMDRVNNSRAFEFIEGHPKVTEDEIVREALKRIKEHQLVVIKPRKKP